MVADYDFPLVVQNQAIIGKPALEDRYLQSQEILQQGLHNIAAFRSEALWNQDLDHFISLINRLSFNSRESVLETKK